MDHIIKKVIIDMQQFLPFLGNIPGQDHASAPKGNALQS